MKISIYNISTLILGSIVLLALHACSTESDSFTDIETEDDIIIDTLVIDNQVILSTGTGDVSLQGIFASCIADGGDSHMNVLAYGADLVVEDGEGVFDSTIFINSWRTEDELVPGTYLTEGYSINPMAAQVDFQSFFEVVILSVSEEVVTGTFRTVQYANNIPAMDVSGRFSVNRFSCEALGIGSDEEFGEYTAGRATLTIGGGEEIVLAASTSCTDIVLGQEGEVAVVTLGGFIHLDSSGEFEWEPPFTGLVITEPVENIEAGVAYDSYLIIDVEGFQNATITTISIEDLQEWGSPITLTYTDLEGEFHAGTLSTSGESIGNFLAESFLCQ